MGDPNYTPMQRTHRWWLRHETDILRPFVIIGLLVVLVFLFTGCAANGYQWHRAHAPSVKPWLYVTVPDTDFVCRTMGADPQRRLNRINACATWKPIGCIIYLPADAPAWLIAHEELHCEGFHHQ